MTKGKGSVRIGPVSLLTLVIVLCIATMAVLSITTAQATYAATERQAAFTEDTYDNESAAQRFVAGIDDILAEVRAGKASGSSALARIESALPTLSGDASTDGMTVDATIDGSTVIASFAKENGRRLDVELTIRNGRTYEITQWKATTQWSEEGGTETLWPGTA